MKKVSDYLLIFLLVYATNSLGSNLDPTKLAKNVYAFIDVNRNFYNLSDNTLANSGFIIGQSGVIVIDSGVSRKTGKLLMDAIQRITPLPITMVILTHADQDFIFGASVFRDHGSLIAAHPETVNLIKSQCQICLDKLSSENSENMRGTEITIPDVTFPIGAVTKIAGETIHILHYGSSKTKGDIMVYHPASKILFSGGIVFQGHIPNMTNCDVDGWLNSLRQVKRLPTVAIVPGHGQVIQGSGNLDAVTYLTFLYNDVLDMYEKSSSLIDVLGQESGQMFQNWNFFDKNHIRNVQEMYLQIELTDLTSDFPN